MNDKLIKQHEEILDDFLEEYNILNNHGIKDELDYERKRVAFVKYYDLDRVDRLTKENYSIGNGKRNTFCYRLERELRKGGSILGSSAPKFGIYYSKKKNDFDLNTKYKTNDVNIVLNIVKEDIKAIINAAKKNDPYLIDNNLVTLPYTVKFKIYNVYNPENDMPVFSVDHLSKIIEAYDIPYDKSRNKEISMREALLHFKNNNQVFNKISNHCFMVFLYSDYSKLYLKGNKVVTRNRENEEVEYVTVVDLVSKEDKDNRNYSDKEPNWNEIATRCSFIGKQGQELVLKKEIDTKPRYKKIIKDVSSNHSFGYDIQSVISNEDDTPLHIEVKTKVNGSADNVRFFITSNELEQMEKDEHYVIYYVCGIKKKNKKIYIIKREHVENIKKNPVLYSISAKAVS